MKDWKQLEFVGSKAIHESNEKPSNTNQPPSRLSEAERAGS